MIPTAIQSLPHVNFNDRRCIPKGERAVYFIVYEKELIYIGISDCIYSRLTSSFTTNHPVGKYLDKIILNSLSFSHKHRWSNVQEKVLYDKAWRERWKNFKDNTLVYWYSVSDSRSELFKIERMFIRKYQPKVNGN